MGDYSKKDWKDQEIPGAIGHSWSYEGMVSPDGTLVAFPYWETNPCPSWKNCDVNANKHFYLAIVSISNREVRKFPHILLPSDMCWTRDNTKLALIANIENEAKSQLIVLDVASGKVDRIANGKKVVVTPQCWSPDEGQLVYFEGDNDSMQPGTIRIFDVTNRAFHDLLKDGSVCKKNIFCASPYPTWSPDGEWIAYFQDDWYRAIHPSGEGTKKLFKKGDALSPLQWSPDGRYALYADCCAFRDTWRCMCEIGRIHVRRLADGADVKISGDGYQNMFVPRWTWIQRKRPLE